MKTYTIIKRSESIDIIETKHGLSDREAIAEISEHLSLNKKFRKPKPDESVWSYYRDYQEFINYDSENQLVSVHLNPSK